MKENLEVRKQIKSKKPHFARTDANKKKQFTAWRNPGGIHNKLRLHRKAHPKLPSIGFSSPKEVRGLSRDGLKFIQVTNLDELKKITKNCILVISKGVGLKKKLEMLKIAKEKGVKVAGIKDLTVYIEAKQAFIAYKRKKAKDKKESKEKKKKELEEKAKEKEKRGDKEDKQKKSEEKLKEEIKKSSPK